MARYSDFEKIRQSSMIRGLVSLDRIITPRIIRSCYLLALFFSTFSSIYMVYNAILLIRYSSIFQGSIMLVLTILGFVFSVLVIRIVAELVLIAFKNNQCLRKMLEKL